MTYWIHKSRNSLLGDKLGLCGCGTGEDFEVVAQVLRFAALEHDAKRLDPVLGGRGCYTTAAHELAAKLLDQHDFIEHGSSIGWPWITEKGRALLGLAESWPVESEEWIEAPDLSAIADASERSD